jgi:hypothetical protein
MAPLVSQELLEVINLALFWSVVAKAIEKPAKIDPRIAERDGTAQASGGLGH